MTNSSRFYKIEVRSIKEKIGMSQFSTVRIEDITQLCENLHKDKVKLLEFERQSYIESLQLTIQHEMGARVKSCIVLINNLTQKIMKSEQ